MRMRIPCRACQLCSPQNAMDLQLGSRAFLRCLLLYAFLTRDSLAQDLTEPPDRPIPPLPERPMEGCPGPSEQGGLICYLSTDCRGGIFLRETDDGGFAALTSAAECCSGAGLSFCDERGCDNCFNEEDYTSAGTEFYLGFFNNLRFESRLSQANLRVQVTSADTEPAEVCITYDGGDEEENVVVEPGQTVSVSIDSDLKATGIGDRDGAVIVQSVNGQRIIVAGLSEEITSADSFCIFPATFLPTVYEYYAVSVPRSQIPFFSDGEQEIITPEEKSAFLIVTTEDTTTVSLTLTQSVSTDGANDLIQFGPMINRGETVSLMLDRRQTLYISDVDDLTGSHVVTDKPITFLSGHECGTIPQTDQYCDQMIEQIPPTATWGVQFFTAPFRSRTGGDAFIALASEDETTINVFCNQFFGNAQELRGVELFLIFAGDTTTFNTTSREYCSFLSDKPILLAQFSLASQTDGNEDADPFMVLVSPRRQYTDSVTFRVFETVTTLNEIHFVNIFIPAEFDRNGVRLNGAALDSEERQPIFCDDSANACAYAAQVLINNETQTVEHVDPEARLAVIVYSLGFRTGQGFSPGMLQRPIALDEISLSDDEYFVSESEGEFLVILERRGRLIEPASILLQSRTQFTENAAQVDEDYFNVSTVVSFAPGQSQATVTVLLAPDDVFPEPNKTFELFLSPSEGIYITPFAAATVIILNDDPDLPVVEVRFADQFPFVVEGQGVLPVTLVKSDDAIGPVRVRLFTQDDTALGGIDYRSLDVIITFAIEETEKTEQIVILDDAVLEDIKFFTISIEAINDLEAGDFPVVAIDTSVVISMEDDDVVVIGFSLVPCRTSEGVEGLNVQVGLLVGRLGRNVSIQFETIARTARVEEDFTPVSRTLVFTPARRGGNLFNVFVGITDDSVLEETETFTIQLSLDDRDIEDDGVQLVHPEAVVFVEDDDSILITLTLMPQVPEGGVALATVAARGGQLGSEVRVRLNTISGNATSGVDFVPINNLEVILDSENPSVSVEILTIDNTMFEGNKQFSVVAELVTFGRVGIDPYIATTTIFDDDVAPQVQCYFSVEDCSVGSNFFPLSSVSDCCLLFQAESFSLSGDKSRLCHRCIVIGFNRSEFLLVERDESYDLRVDVITGFLPQSNTLGLVAIPGTATLDDYFIPPTLTLLFNPVAPASTNVLVNLPREVDDTDLPFESFRIEIEDSFGTAPPNMFFRGTVITIIDYEPVIQFSSMEYVLQGEQGPVFVGFVMSPPTIGPLLMTLRLVSGTAIIGEDVEELETTVFEFEPGTTDALLPALTTVIEDDILEDQEEIFTVEIVSVSEGVIGEASTATVIILDDDSAMIGFIFSFGRTTYHVNEDDGAVTVPVGVIEGQLGRDVVVQVSTISDIASEFEDYTPVTQNLTFNAQSQVVNVTILITNDDIPDGFEYFVVQLNLVTDIRDVILEPSWTQVTITDYSRFGFNTTTMRVSEFSEIGEIVVTGVGPAPDASVTVQLALFNGTATVGRDVVLVGTESESTAIVTVEPKSFTASVLFGVIPDDIYELDEESFTVRIVFVSGGFIDSNRQELNVTIRDETILFVGLFSFETQVRENVSAVFIQPFLEGFTEVPISLLITVTNDTRDILIDFPVTLATPGEDFLPVDDVPIIVLPGRQEPPSIPVRIINDDRTEVTRETVFFFFTTEMPRITTFQDQFSNTFQIIDDDSVHMRFSQALFIVSEIGGPVVEGFLSVVSGVLGVDYTVRVSTRDLGERQATVGSDYIALDEVFTFNSEVTRVFFNITILNDDILEQIETFGLAAEAVSDFDIDVRLPELSIIQIGESDDLSSQFQIGFGTQLVTIPEGESEPLLEIIVTDGFLLNPVTVELEYISGTAEVGFDIFDLVTNVTVMTTEVGSRALVRIDPIFDERYEEDEEFLTVRIVSVSDGLIDPESQEATVIILDMDFLFIEVERFAIREGSQEQGDITLNIFIVSDVSIELRAVSVFNDTLLLPDEGQQEIGRQATPDVDYFPVNQSLFLEAGQSSLTTTLQLTPLDDPITEGPEFVIIDYIPVGRSRIGVFAESPATIVDDDTTVIGFSSTVFDAFEGSFDPPEEGQVTVIVDVLLGELADGVQYSVNFETVELVDQPDVATEGEDYIPVQRILTFSSAVTSEQISIQLPADDISGEFMEQFEVRISPAEESSSSPLLVALEPSVATVTIQDATPQ